MWAGAAPPPPPLAAPPPAPPPLAPLDRHSARRPPARWAAAPSLDAAYCSLLLRLKRLIAAYCGFLCGRTRRTAIPPAGDARASASAISCSLAAYCARPVCEAMRVPRRAPAPAADPPPRVGVGGAGAGAAFSVMASESRGADKGENHCIARRGLGRPARAAYCGLLWLIAAYCGHRGLLGVRARSPCGRGRKAPERRLVGWHRWHDAASLNKRMALNIEEPSRRGINCILRQGIEVSPWYMRGVFRKEVAVQLIAAERFTERL